MFTPKCAISHSETIYKLIYFPKCAIAILDRLVAKRIIALWPILNGSKLQ